MRQKLSVLAAVAFASTLCVQEGTALASPVVPLVAQGQGQLQLVKKKSEESSDDGERGWWDYLKMSLTFADEEVAEEVVDGRILEHLVGGLFAAFGGHIWMPTISYKDVEAPPAANTLGIISTVLAWAWAPFLLYAWWPWVGWIFGFPPLLIMAITGAVFNIWFIPRAIQFAYSDAYGSGGGGGGDKGKKKSKKKKKKAAEDDDE